jgi:ParB family chromosome partitioning protein
MGKAAFGGKRVGNVAFSGKRGDIFYLKPDELHLVTDKASPLYDPRVDLPVDEKLVLNIMVHGVISPLVVTKQEGAAVVVDGRQRAKAAAEASRRLVAEGKEPILVACVQRKDTMEDLFGVSVSANEQRQDDSPLLKAQKAAKLQHMGKTAAEVAVLFGVTPQAVYQWGKLLECAAPVRKAVEQGRLAASAAVQLAGLPSAEQENKLEELLASSGGKRPTARKARAAAAGKRVVEGRMRSRKQVEERLAEKHLPADYRKALRWVLRQE